MGTLETRIESRFTGISIGLLLPFTKVRRLSQLVQSIGILTAVFGVAPSTLPIGLARKVSVFNEVIQSQGAKQVQTFAARLNEAGPPPAAPSAHCYSLYPLVLSASANRPQIRSRHHHPEFSRYQTVNMAAP